MNPHLRNWLLIFGLLFAVIAADQVTKNAVLDNLQLGETNEIVPALAPFFQITRSQNTGSAFGLFPQAGDILMVIALVVPVVLIVYAVRLPQEAWFTRLAIGLICGGALGNAVDRIQHGVVVDFIHYRIPGVVSNVSNIADHAIVLGVLIIFVQSWRLEQQHNREKAAQASADLAAQEHTDSV